jgi:hypothetical protein
VIKLISDLRQVGGFCLGTPVSTTNKTDLHDISEILLKVAINTINQTKPKTKGLKQVRQKSVYVTNARGDFETKCKLQQPDTRKCQIMSNAFLKAKIDKGNVIEQDWCY